MGLFQQMPEDPEEWAGLPSEPLRPTSDAETLTDAGAVGDIGLELLTPGLPGGTHAEQITSIVIPVDPAAVEDE